MEGSGGYRALADGNGNGFTGVPLAVKCAFDPWLGRHQPRFLGGKVNASAVTDAKQIAVISKAINAEFHADGVEKDVAGFQDGIVQVSGSVRSGARLGGIDITFELAAVEGAVAWAIGGETFGDGVVFEHCSGGDDFEDGAGRELRLNGTVKKRMQRIFIKLAPFFFWNANGEIIGIGSGAADHRQYFAGAWIKRDHRAGTNSQGLLGDLL